MEQLNFSININAPREKVWNTLWEDTSYRKWTAAFTEGSHAVTDHWKKGSKVLFLDDKGSGMVSRVEDNKPNEYMSFVHLGEVKNGVEDTSGEQWAGATENYTLTKKENGTELQVDMQSELNDEFKNYFAMTWPKALEKVKEIAEEK